MKWWDNYKKKKEAEAVAIRAERDRLEACAKEMIAYAKSAMLKKYCPIMDDYCNDKCAHFKAGYIYYMPSFSHLDSQWIKIYPKCKLWGKNG